MRIDKAIHKNASSLILFFAGWSASPDSFRQLEVPEHTDLWICYDYRELTFQEDLAGYRHIHLVAWSLGVWVADLLFSGKQTFDSLTAINGTPCPIDDLYGIPRNIFEGTLANISEQGMSRFNLRMCGDRGTWDTYSKTPGRSLEEIRAELQHLHEQITSRKASCPHPDGLPWDKAIIGSGDRIFPAENLRRYWQDRAAITDIPAPHFPFYHYQAWNELWN